MCPPLRSVHAPLPSSLGIGDDQRASYPASQSTGPVAAGPPHAWKPSALQPPLAGEPRSELSPWTTPMPPNVVTPFTGRLPAVSAILPSAPILKAQTSANASPNINPQDTTLPASISYYGHLGRSSPAISQAPAPLPVSKWPHPPFGTTDPVRVPPGVAGGRISRGETPSIGAAVQPESPPLPGMIPCVLDLKSGSSSEAKKRKANSAASQRFRNRRRNEIEMQQKITAQQDEMRKLSDALERRDREIQRLLQELDYYKNIARSLPASQLHARPTSPRSSNKPSWSPPGNMRKTAGGLAPEELCQPAPIPAGQPISSTTPPPAVHYPLDDGPTWRLS